MRKAEVASRLLKPRHEKISSAEEAVSRIPDEATIMIGGFVQCGVPETLIDALVGLGRRGLVIISNNVGLPGKGIGKLIRERRIKKLIASHIGLNPEVEAQMKEGLDVELVPQGTLAERIRAGGAGLGGFLTPTGLGTMAQEGKQVINVDGRNYLLEKPLRADFALIKAHVADRIGNLRYRLTARNFNPIMATAAEWVIAEVDELLEDRYLSPDDVMTPGIFIDSLVIAEKRMV
ncbi:3-oxoacid CoA-transferase, subunit A [Moorella glycerini]|uniref:Acetate CoA-transferase subunit alpha n=1 Tax=Neomoorella stamsii TaxID=1266720 RepID=A0A9X7J386_9FIRM|nr:MULTISPECIES: CoA transferase subunit A [Moorella]PRR73412.1 Acetate CoA-transferase subunit alpha [Moorella stamsii]CEP69181.1 3-oxoacid CoA-transferase, subunit A [Moorella glycerini]